MIQIKVNEKIVWAYELKDVDALIDKIRREIKWKTTYKYDSDGLRHQVVFADYPISFDIETSSFYNNLEGTKFFTNKEVEDILDAAYRKEFQKYMKKENDVEYATIKAELKKARLKNEYQQRACMYIWQMAFGTNDTVIIGRTWAEFITLLYDLKFDFDLSDCKKMIIYDYNYHYEFGFIQNYFTWDNEDYGCLLSDRVTYYTNTAGIYKPDPEMPTGVCVESFYGFLWKDALILSGVKEEKLNKIMNKYKNNAYKLVGNLDYDKIRHYKTKLTNDELAYCINDVILLNWYIQEKIEEYGSIVDIPLTKTGETRERVRTKVLYTNPNIKSKKDHKYINYRKFLDRMKIDLQQYQMIKRAYAGGFTHANYNHSKKVFNDCIMSIDIASSYPAVMVSKKFPMGPYERVIVPNKETFVYFIKNYSCLFDIHIKGISPRLDGDLDFDCIDNIISINKINELGQYFPNLKPVYKKGCTDKDCFVNNNGRLRHAEDIYMTINEVDFENIMNFYDIEDFDVDNFFIAKKDYLPRDLILAVLELFYKKTTYKPFDGTDTAEGIAYALSKVDINGIYGMVSTDPLKLSYKLDKTEGFYKLESLENKYKDDPDAYNDYLAIKLEKKLDGKNEFLCYQWSHILTSWARYNLFQAILASGVNHVYSDTDSEKFIKNDKTLKFVKEYNENIDKEMNECFAYHHIKKDSHKASYIKEGKTIVKCLGYFEIENGGECYKKFVTTGAKRYLTQTSDGELHLTVAGLNKKSVQYMQEKYGDKLFEEFANGNIYVDREHTGKLMATYIPFTTKGIVTDYNNETVKFAELSSVHLEKNDFDMHITDAYEQLTQEGRILEGI